MPTVSDSIGPADIQAMPITKFRNLRQGVGSDKRQYVALELAMNEMHPGTVITVELPEDNTSAYVQRLRSEIRRYANILGWRAASDAEELCRKGISVSTRVYPDQDMKPRMAIYRPLHTVP